MTKALGIALVAVGILLLVLGSQSSNSMSSDFSRFFTGSPTNKAIWLLVGGIGSVIVGAVLALRGRTR